MQKRKTPDGELLRTLSKVNPTNIVRVDLSTHFPWPEMREIEGNEERDDSNFEEREWR